MMLALKDAWTNEVTGRSGFALWFAAIDPDGQWWWLIAGVSQLFGLSNAYLYKIEGRNDIILEMQIDGHGGWTPIDPSEALDRARSEFERLHLAPWVQVYPDHYRRVRDQYARFRDAIEGLRAPEPYP
jgi:hypothetical protein